jgi:hypothetical protein
MRQATMKIFLVLVTLLAGLGSGTTANANKLDLALAGFIECNTTGDQIGQCVPLVSQYEQFMAEYAFGIAPKILAPAETLGYSGFYMALEGTLTPRPRGDASANRWKRGTATTEWPDVMFNPGIHIRKGLPWSFEIGSTINYLAQSELVGLGGEIKWSLFEGYRKKLKGGLPDIAARGSVMRVLGESDVDMTIIGVDGSLSYAFGIGGMVSLTPYAGFQYLWTIIRVEPLIYRDDENSNPADPNRFKPETNGLWNANGLSGPNLERMRLFGGFRFGYELLSITLEIDWGLPQEWEASDPEKTKTSVGHQIQLSSGIGLDF